MATDAMLDTGPMMKDKAYCGRILLMKNKNNIDTVLT